MLTMRLGRHFRAHGDASRALPRFREGVAIFERTRPPDDPERARAALDLGSALRELGRSAEVAALAGPAGEGS